MIAWSLFKMPLTIRLSEYFGVCVMGFVYLDTQKAQTSVAYSLTEAFALPLHFNNQQETYAGMKTHYTQERCSMDIIIPIGIY